MPRARNARKFPREYYDYVRQVAEESKQVDFGITEGEARRLRGSFYAFVGALRRQEQKYKDAVQENYLRVAGGQKPLPIDPELEHDAEVSRLSDKVSVEVGQFGMRLIHIEDTELARLLSKGFTSAPRPMPERVKADAKMSSDLLLEKLASLGVTLEGAPAAAVPTGANGPGDQASRTINELYGPKK